MTTTRIKEVAERAGVSVGTVSNVLNRPEMVAVATRQRVLDAITELGFVRNEAARALRVGRSRTVGLVVLNVANPFFTDVAAGAEAVADAFGTVVTLCNSAEDAERERRHLDHLEQQRVQGVLITPVNERHPLIEQLIARGIPIVLVDRASGRRNRCSVTVDDVLGGRLAAQHLVDQGHRRIAFVGGPTSVRQVAERRQGAAEVVAESGPEVALTLVDTKALTVAEGKTAGSRIVDTAASRRPSAVFCANDLLALGLLQALTQGGVRVPEDVAIVGYDDIEYAAAAAVPLSSIRQPREQLGRTAAELLFDEISSGAAHRHRQVVFEPDLVVRASSAFRRVRRRPAARRRDSAGAGDSPVGTA